MQEITGTRTERRRRRAGQNWPAQRREDRNGGNGLARTLLIGAGIAAAAFGFYQANRRAQSQDSGSSASRQRQHERGSREARQDTLLAWLNDAYALERSVAQSLKAHAADAKHHPEVRERLERHLEETKRHGAMVKDRIESLGGSVSALKSGLSTVMGAVSGIASTPAKDSLVKDMLADSAAEQLEISSYKGIIAAAEELGDIETVRIARQILRDEEEMLAWFERQLPHAIRDEMAHA